MVRLLKTVRGTLTWTKTDWCECRPNCAGTWDTRQQTRRFCGWHSSKRRLLNRSNGADFLLFSVERRPFRTTSVPMWSKLETQGYGIRSNSSISLSIYIHTSPVLYSLRLKNSHFSEILNVFKFNQIYKNILTFIPPNKYH